MDNNWTIQQTKELFDLAHKASLEGKGLVYAFNTMAKKCSRSSNSVRNYYYSQLKMFELVPELAKDLGVNLIKARREEFTPFKEQEINELVERVLTGKAQGKSVRAIIAELSGGNAKTALRLQNKYRSMLTHHRKRVTAIMEDMSKRNITYYDPYAKTLSSMRSDNFSKLTEYIAGLDDKDVGKFLNLISKLI